MRTFIGCRFLSTLNLPCRLDWVNVGFCFSTTILLIHNFTHIPALSSCLLQPQPSATGRNQRQSNMNLKRAVEVEKIFFISFPNKTSLQLLWLLKWNLFNQKPPFQTPLTTCCDWSLIFFQFPFQRALLVWSTIICFFTVKLISCQPLGHHASP